jgi:hypothetical protein
MQQFLCAGDDEGYTHTIDKVAYNVPSKQATAFYERVQAVIGFGRKSVRERVPELTPAHLSLTVPVGEAATSDEAVSVLAQVGLAAVLAGEHRSSSEGAAVDEAGKVCVVLRSGTYTGQDGVDVESFFFLYPRLLVRRDGESEGDVSPLQSFRRQVTRDFARVAAETEELVSWNIKGVMKDEVPKIVLLCGSAASGCLARTFFAAYDHRGEKIEIESVFDQKERGLPSCYLYSLGRLARRIERVGELSPELKRVEEVLRMLSARRTDLEGSDAQVVAQALYQASKGSAEGMVMLEDFLGPQEGVADKARELWCWAMTARTRYTMMSVKYMASRDNPALFSRMTGTEIKEPMWESTGPHGSHLDVCHALKALYGHIFAYDEAEEAWYSYEGTHWREKGEKELRDKMRKELLPMYKRLYDQISKLPSRNENESKAYKERAKKCGTWIKALGEKGPKVAIIGEASDLFAVEKLGEKLDGPISYTTFAFADCVLNLVPEAPARSSYSDGRPEDFCRRSSPVPMRNTGYSMEHPAVVALMAYLRQVLSSYDEEDEPNDEVLWYMVDRTAVCLEGGNRLKNITIGEGPLANNSKSTYESMVHDGMGGGADGYSVTIATAKIVGKKRGDGDGPTPALRHAQGGRLLWGKETSKGERLNAGQLLELTSGLDPIPLRDPHSKRTIEVIPSYKIFLFVNNSPKLDAEEMGIFIRVKLVLWLSQFLETGVPEDPREQRRQRKYPIDPNFASKRIAMIAPLMWLLGERYKVVGKFGPKEPRQVQEYVERYKRANDIFLRFIDDVTEDAEGTVEVDSLYTEFCTWHKKRSPGAQWYGQDDLADWMTKKYGPAKWGTTWEGMRLRPKVQRIAS